MAATINATIKSETANSYVTLAEANSYFETVPDSSTWTNKTDDQKNRALISATREIDNLVFYGDRCDEDQALKFPRTNYQVDRVELSCSTIPLILNMHSMNWLEHWQMILMQLLVIQVRQVFLLKLRLVI